MNRRDFLKSLPAVLVGLFLSIRALIEPIRRNKISKNTSLALRDIHIAPVYGMGAEQFRELSNAEKEAMIALSRIVDWADDRAWYTGNWRDDEPDDLSEFDGLSQWIHTGNKQSNEH